MAHFVINCNLPRKHKYTLNNFRRELKRTKKAIGATNLRKDSKGQLNSSILQSHFKLFFVLTCRKNDKALGIWFNQPRTLLTSFIWESSGSNLCSIGYHAIFTLYDLFRGVYLQPHPCPHSLVQANCSCKQVQWPINPHILPLPIISHIKLSVATLKNQFETLYYALGKGTALTLKSGSLLSVTLTCSKVPAAQGTGVRLQTWNGQSPAPQLELSPKFLPVSGQHSTYALTICPRYLKRVQIIKFLTLLHSLS